jgi:hypothetical protein
MAAWCGKLSVASHGTVGEQQGQNTSDLYSGQSGVVRFRDVSGANVVQQSHHPWPSCRGGVGARCQSAPFASTSPQQSEFGIVNGRGIRAGITLYRKKRTRIFAKCPCDFVQHFQREARSIGLVRQRGRRNTTLHSEPFPGSSLEVVLNLRSDVLVNVLSRHASSTLQCEQLMLPFMHGILRTSTRPSWCGLSQGIPRVTWMQSGRCITLRIVSCLPLHQQANRSAARPETICWTEPLDAMAFLQPTRGIVQIPGAP